MKEITNMESSVSISVELLILIYKKIKIEELIFHFQVFKKWQIYSVVLT